MLPPPPLKPPPLTRDGYRYFLCEDDDALCSHFIKDYNQQLEQNKKGPLYHLKRLALREDVKLSDCDKAHQLKLEDDCMRVTGEKGYSMIRATHGTNRGCFYYECIIDSMPDDSAARIGWGQRFANLQAPLGYDYFGYSWRSLLGTKFHQARGKTYDLGDEQRNNRGYKQGDIVGCLIELPVESNHIEPRHLPNSIKGETALLAAKKRDVQYRHCEQKDTPPALNSLKIHKGSRISYFKNGQPIGVAFEDIFEGTYFPSISLYKNCTVSVNFGPHFKFEPTLVKTEFRSGDKHHQGWPLYQPVHDLAFRSIIDHLMADMLFVLDYVEHYDEITKTFKNMFREGIDVTQKSD